MRKHGRELNASFNFYRSQQTKEVQARMSKLVDLIDMVLFIELAGNPNFLPLFASLYDATDLIRKKNEKFLHHIYNHDRNDKLIGYNSDSPSPSIFSLKEHLVELNKRYPLLLAKLEEMKTEAALPADVFAGIKFGEIYRLLDGIAQMAVELRTPEELSELRQQLRTKTIQLANLRAKRQPQPSKP